jgi:hypothetical protein
MSATWEMIREKHNGAPWYACALRSLPSAFFLLDDTPRVAAGFNMQKWDALFEENMR